MSEKVGYNDLESRELVKKFYKAKFGIELVDTPDSFLKFSSGEERMLIPGKYNFDLIPSENLNDFKFVEVERVGKNHPAFDPTKETFDVVISKYWKYCNCQSYSGKIVYVQMDANVCLNGRLAIVDTADICRNRIFRNYKKKQSNVNSDGFCEFYEIPKKNSKNENIIEYYDFSNNFPRIISNSMPTKNISPIIKVNEETRKNYWMNKSKNYSISDFYINNYDILRFQGYSENAPFIETEKIYILNREDVKRYAKKYGKLSSKDYSLISKNEIEKYSQISLKTVE